MKVETENGVVSISQGMPRVPQELEDSGRTLLVEPGEALQHLDFRCLASGAVRGDIYVVLSTPIIVIY